MGGERFLAAIETRLGQTKSVESLVAYCRENDRVCPVPQRWDELWNLLPDRRQVGGGWAPSLPLILAAWHYTSDTQKRLRLAEHIEWAAEHGALAPVAGYVQGLGEEDWFHIGE